MLTKRFDQKLFEENDAAARHAVTQYLLATSDVIVENNPDKYGVDLLVTGGLQDYAIECEIKRVWKGADFPWNTVQLPARKQKFSELGIPVEYWILNADLTYAMLIRSDVLQHLTPVEVPNKYVARGEMFYQIPLTSCSLVILEKQ